MLDWLRLIRAGGMTTILANIMAAMAATGLDFLELLAQLQRHGSGALWVVLSSLLLYACGMVWNDLADVERDRELAPRRPLPSGRIGYGTAWVFGVVIASLALLCAAQLGWRGFSGAAIVLILALSYDLGGKRVPWLGSVLMAATRAAHAVFALLILGPDYFDLMVLECAALVGLVTAPASAGLPVYPLLLGCYVIGLTLISELEHRRSYRWELLFGGAVIMTAIALAGYCAVTSDLLHGEWIQRRVAMVAVLGGVALILTLWLTVRILKPWITAVQLGQRNAIPPVVIRGLSGMIIFDALIASIYRPELVVPILLLLIPFGIIGRIARMD